jgi:hypothetical protein
MLHLAVAGGYEATIQLPLRSGTTAGGSTTLLFENTDPDAPYSLGEVRLSFVFQADAISIMAGGLVVQGPCAYAFTRVEAGDLAGTLSCGDDLQALVEGDPREITITGTFDAAS